MAVRQYIGARYVPKFVGLWNNTTIYNALEVVDNGSGTSYIARKTVPAGTPLTNTEFWFVYGASSGAIIDLQNQINDINNDINILDFDMNLIKNNKILFMGDSYNRYFEGQGWDAECARLLGGDTSRHAYLSSGGYSFTRAGYEFITLLQNNIDSIDNKDQFTDIFVCAGANEDSNQAAMTSAINTFKTYCKSQFPNATLRIGFVGWSGFSSIRSRMVNNCNYYIEACKSLGIPYFHNVEYVLHNYDLLYDNRSENPSDYHHPTPEGNIKLGDAIIQAYLTGSADVRYEQVCTITPSDDAKGHFSSNSPKCTVILHNDTLYMEFSNYYMLEAITANRGDKIDLGTINTHLMWRSPTWGIAMVGFPSGSPVFDACMAELQAIDAKPEVHIKIDWRGQARSGATGGILMPQSRIIMDSMRN